MHTHVFCVLCVRVCSAEFYTNVIQIVKKYVHKLKKKLFTFAFFDLEIISSIFSFQVFFLSSLVDESTFVRNPPKCCSPTTFANTNNQINFKCSCAITCTLHKICTLNNETEVTVSENRKIRDRFG